MRRTDAGAGEHGHRKLRDHWHVDGDTVALGDAVALEHVGELLHFCQQVGIGHGAVVARLALPVVGDLVASTGRDVAIQGVVADVELAADEPAGEGQVPFEDRVPLGVPVEQVEGLLGPEALPILVGLVVQEGAGGEALLLEVLGRREAAVLDEVVLDGGAGVLLGHVVDPPHVRLRSSTLEGTGRRIAH